MAVGGAKSSNAPAAWENPMSGTGLLKIGIVGSVVAALCCFTPILAVVLAALGLAALVGWLDLVLIPLLLGFIALTLYALWRRRSA